MRILNYRHLFNFNAWEVFDCIGCLVVIAFIQAFAQASATGINSIPRQRISINEDWRFFKYDWTAKADKLIYNVRPEVKGHKDDRSADANPAEAEDVKASQNVVKPWMLTGNGFIKNTAKRYVRPEGDPW